MLTLSSLLSTKLTAGGVVHCVDVVFAADFYNCISQMTGSIQRRYGTRFHFSMRSVVDISQLNLPSGTNN